MSIEIDVTFDFTNDTPNYWKNFNNNMETTDPDIWSPTLRDYQQKLYRKILPNGEFFNLQKGNSPAYDYLYWKNFRFGSDSIINIYTHHNRPQWLVSEIKKTKDDFEEFRKKYLRTSYTIGGEIIFPKRRWSINQSRGINSKIKDRFDLTLECIRRFYNNEISPLSHTFENDKDFFNLFLDFKGYVDFFYLNDLVSKNYKNIEFYLNFDDFNSNPLPQTLEEWNNLYEKQIEFLNKRNSRISQIQVK